MPTPLQAPLTSTAPLSRPLRAWFFLLTCLVWLALSPSGGPFAAHTPGSTSTPVVVLDGEQSSVPLAGRSTWWVDASGQSSVREVAQRYAELPFVVRDSLHRVRLTGDAALWVRFDAWTQDSRSHWELELARSGTDRISLHHQRADGSWLEQHAGDSLPVKDWASPDRYPVFALEPRVDGPVTYWVRIQHARVPFSGELVVHSHSRLREQRMVQQFLLGGYFGMAMLLTAIAVVNGLVFRDTSFGAYAIYITLLGLSLAASLGVGGQFLWPNAPHLNGSAEFVLLPLAAVAATAGPAAATTAAPAAAPPAVLMGRIELAAALQGRLQPGDTLFITARAAPSPSAGGAPASRMPLAVIRRPATAQASDFRLDDSLAMAAGHSLSSHFAQKTPVVVEARISRSGQALPQPGDLLGRSAAFTASAQGVRVLIDRVQP